MQLRSKDEDPLDRIDRLVLDFPCALEEHYPMSVCVNSSSKDVTIHGVVRTTSWNWDGCGGRTDLHDFFSATWAAVLRANGLASSRLIGEEGWGGSPELYARVLLFDQPYGGVLPRGDHKRIVDRIRAHTAWAYHGITEVVGFEKPDVREPEWKEDEPPPWVPAVRELLSVKGDELWATRANPDWRYYTAEKNAFSITELMPNRALGLRLCFPWYEPVAIQRGGRHILRASGLFNSVPSHLIRKGVQIIRCVEQDAAPAWKGLDAKPTDDAIIAIPLESHCVFFGRQTIVVLRGACGYEKYLSAREEWALRSEAEANIFNFNTECVWNEHINPRRFEDLAAALLGTEPGFRWRGLRAAP